MMRNQRSMPWGVAAAMATLLLGAAGCGKSLSTGTGPSPSGGITRVLVAPATDGTVTAGQSVTFTATAIGNDGRPTTATFAWKVVPPAGMAEADFGTITPQGTDQAVFKGLKPDPNGQMGKVEALVSGGDGSVPAGEFPVSVVLGPISDLKVDVHPLADGSPAQVDLTQVAVGSQVTFQVTGVDLGGNAVGQSKARSRVALSPAWSVTGGIGTIDAASGVFTAAGAGINKTGQVVAKVATNQGTVNVSVVAGDKPTYVGAEVCKGCHADAYNQWKTTAHSSAYDRKMAAGALAPNCVSCHVVGYGKGGWVDAATTPNLTNIQCENCHGPGSQHVAGGGDKSKILTGAQVLAQPQICGGCHTGSHHGTYEEWAVSPHSKNSGEGTETIPTSSQLATCGVCHGGVGRQVLRTAGKAGMPTDPAFVALATTTAQPCATCHDPHQATGHGTITGSYPSMPQVDIQLRGLEQSTAFYTMDYNGDTKAEIATADAGVNICGGCHNSRNAYWQSAGRAPHHSPQYNMLIGDVGQLSGSTVVSNPAPVTAQSAHRDVEGQCTHCHMHKDDATTPPLHGHLFTVNMNGCAPCHSASDAGARKASTQDDIRQRMDAVKARLDTWATTMAPAALSSKYGALSWEYTVPGEFGNPNGDSSIVGPNSTEQKTIPAAIQQARFNLYMVLHDGSYGVHNAKFARYLLDQANTLLTSIGVP